MSTGKIERRQIDQSHVLLESDEVLKADPNDGIHEGQVSLTHGFVPYQPISASLPSYYKSWEELSDKLPTYISEGSEREHIKSLPLLEVDEKHLPNSHLSRSIAIIGNLAHAYYFNQRLGQTQKEDTLPDSILIPWQALMKRIQRRMPPDTQEAIQAVRIHYDTFLTNWNLKKEVSKPIDGKHNRDITLDDLSILSPIFGSKAEYNFNMTFVIMELRFAVALGHMSSALKAVANKDDDALINALQKLTSAIEDVTEGLDYINPNPHSEHHVDPSEWTKTVAKIDGKIPGGVSGLSGSAMPLFHTLDTFIERRDYNSTMGKAMKVKYQHQPKHVQEYLAALQADLSKYSIRKYVENSENPRLKSQYDLLIKSYLSEEGLMGAHTLKVYGYMKINFRNGRLLTNGGHDGTSTIATEPQRHIYDDFAQADLERYGDYQPVQAYATKISMHFYSDKAAKVVLDVSKTALQFQPGDHCAIRPENSEARIEEFLKSQGLEPKTIVPLNNEWKKFFRSRGVVVDQVKLDVILKHAELGAYPVQKQELNINQLKPIKPRYYSVSPVKGSPQKIGLTVGRYNNGEGRSIGLCSTYLMSDAPTYAIDRIPARHFHLPKSSKVPVLMFAAGTGISPFIGFIDNRSQHEGTQNYLFYSTPDLESFYNQNELEEAVTSGKLNMSVIFSRGDNYDTGEFTSKGFQTKKKYPGKHVDQLIKEQEKQIADLILNQHAHVYVCGNPGFADTVRKGIVDALSGNEAVKDPAAYVDTMMADFRFNNDVYAAIDPGKKYPSYYASEIAMHNKSDDCWGIINGTVYNLTQFIQEHPGGDKIILVNAGLDMTTDYNYIKHNQRPQIEGLLQKYKIGVLVSPELRDPGKAKLYESSKKFVEGVTEMENTLRNNTKFPKGREDAYLWREVYGVFVGGSLASYRKTGSGNAGSLSYVFGSLLDEVVTKVNYSSDRLKQAHEELLKQANNCAEYLRQSSIGPLSSDEMALKKRGFDMIMDQTYKFLVDVKKLSIEMMSELEKDQFSELKTSAYLESITQRMNDYSGVIHHVVTQLPKLERHTPKISDMEGGGCVFAKQLTGSRVVPSERPSVDIKTDLPVISRSSDAQAISKLGLMPAPKQPVVELKKEEASVLERALTYVTGFLSNLNPSNFIH